MPAIKYSIEIDCPPEEVFAYATDPARFPEWQHDVASVHAEGPFPLGVGSRFTQTRWVGRSQRTMTQEIIECVPPQRWAVRGVSGPIRPNAKITVEPLEDGRASLAKFDLDFKGHGFGILLVPLVRRMATKGAPYSFRNLKKQLEKGSSRAVR